MFSAAELIDALHRRRRLKSIRPEVPGQLPTGWREWLAAMPQRTGAVTGARAVDIIAYLLQRPLRAPPAAGADLNRWQAFATIWRQQWHPASEDERWLRIAAASGSLLIHLVLTVMLAWLMYLRFMAMPAPAAETSVVQVQYVGQGTPETPVPSPREAPAQPPSNQDEPVADVPARAATPAPAARPVASVPEPVAAIPEPEIVPPPQPAPALDIVAPTPQPPAPVPQQPLQVTEVAQPQIEFVLVAPIPPAPELAQPSLAVPELTVPVAQIERVEVEPVPSLSVPAISVPQTIVSQAPLPLPEVSPRPQAVVAEQVPLDIPPIQSPTVPAPPRLNLPKIALPSPEPVAEPVPAPATQTAATPAAPERPSPPVADAGDQAASESPAAAASASVNPSPASATDTTTPAAATPNPWPTARRGDDWGEALRAKPGSQTGQPPGLFDEAGRPRLADNPGQPAQGAAPGSAEQQAIDLDRAGTWLKRPPYDYTPTRFDRFWIPGGSLLEEWVRRGIKQVSIPIPGTSKRIDCVVSLLQLGGGCMLADDDLNNQPATARPPPDIPFKPELQENQESLRQEDE